MSLIAYRREIDGLRAVAVVPVILFHLQVKALSGGFLGVDVFFVISGYLITSIILAEMSADRFSFREFWARRARRILPALLVVIATSLLAYWWFLSRTELPGVGQEAMAALGSVSNIYYLTTSISYWGNAADYLNFLHCWSLSVEEQFYLVFPLLVWLHVRYRPQNLIAFLVTLMVLSFALVILTTKKFPDATFYLLPTRAWELAAGALLAALERTPGQSGARAIGLPATWSGPAEWAGRWCALLGIAGLCLIAFSYCVTLRRFPKSIIPVYGTCLVIGFARTGLSRNLLSHPSLLHIGKLSYSLYLWHWPVMVFARKLDVAVNSWILLIPIYVLSLATYHAVEQPGRKKHGTLAVIGVAYLTLLIVSGLFASSDGKYDTSEFNRPEYAGISYNVLPRPQVHEALQRITAGCSVPDRLAKPDAYKAGGIIVGEGNSPPDVVVLGDSHGCMWSKAIHHVTDELGVKASFWSIDGVDPFSSSATQAVLPSFIDLTAKEFRDYSQGRRELIKQWHPKLVIVCARWAKYDHEPENEFLRFLSQNADEVLLIEQPPELTIGKRSVLQYLCYQQIKPVSGTRQYLPLNQTMTQKASQRFRDLLHENPNCKAVRTADLYTHGAEALCLDSKEVVYLDDDHLTTFGSLLSLPRLEETIGKALKNVPQASRTPENGASFSPDQQL